MNGKVEMKMIGSVMKATRNVKKLSKKLKSVIKKILINAGMLWKTTIRMSLTSMKVREQTGMMKKGGFTKKVSGTRKEMMMEHLK